MKRLMNYISSTYESKKNKSLLLRMNNMRWVCRELRGRREKEKEDE